MSKKVIAVYEQDNFKGYIKSAVKRCKNGFDLAYEIWDCKVYQSEDMAERAVAQYRERGSNYSFVVKDFKL